MTPPAPTPKPPRPIPGRIGGVLKVLLTLIAHARHFAAIATARVDVPEFAPAAAIFGTYDVPVILLRMRRGILRALALQRYLLARAARGSNLRFHWAPTCTDLQPHHRPPPRPAPARRSAPLRPRRPEPSLLGPDDPGAFYLPTPEELDAEVRRRPVGRTMAYICLDLGIVPSICDGTFWNKVEKIMRRHGGSLGPMFRLRAKREETFLRERDRRPETWHIDWRNAPRSEVRHALGYMIGEPVEAACLPAIVPS